MVRLQVYRNIVIMFRPHQLSSQQVLPHTLASLPKLMMDLSLSLFFFVPRKGKADSQSASLEAHARQIQQLQDTNVTMKADLQRAKTSLTNEPKLQERVSELEGLVASMEQEKQQLEVSG